jgi:hypothetical protein
MRTITSVRFGFALSLSAFALTSVPTSALEAPAATPTANSAVTKVQEGYHEERAEHCEHVRRECRERHGDREEFRECVERERCEPRDFGGEPEHAERCEHVRRECHERHGDREEYRECVERRDCEPREREHAERCERVRNECRERHGDREEFRECLVRHDCD